MVRQASARPDCTYVQTGLLLRRTYRVFHPVDRTHVLVLEFFSLIPVARRASLILIELERCGRHHLRQAFIDIIEGVAELLVRLHGGDGGVIDPLGVRAHLGDDQRDDRSQGQGNEQFEEGEACVLVDRLWLIDGQGSESRKSDPHWWFPP